MAAPTQLSVNNVQRNLVEGAGKEKRATEDHSHIVELYSLQPSATVMSTTVLRRKQFSSGEEMLMNCD